MSQDVLQFWLDKRDELCRKHACCRRVGEFTPTEKQVPILQEYRECLDKLTELF